MHEPLSHSLQTDRERRARAAAVCRCCARRRSSCSFWGCHTQIRSRYVGHGGRAKFWATLMQRSPRKTEAHQPRPGKLQSTLPLAANTIGILQRARRRGCDRPRWTRPRRHPHRHRQRRLLLPRPIRRPLLQCFRRSAPSLGLARAAAALLRWPREWPRACAPPSPAACRSLTCERSCRNCGSRHAAARRQTPPV